MLMEIDGVFNLCDAIISQANTDAGKEKYGRKHTFGNHPSNALCPISGPAHTTHVCAENYIERLKEYVESTREVSNEEIALEQLRLANGI